jgi:GDSL-like Lipase/Acylhydrolase family
MRREHALRAVLAVASVIFTLAAFEIGLRALKPKPRPRPPPAVVACGDCPYLFANNPAHPGISPQGLRDRVFSPAPPEGTFRILVLGDSVSYGLQTSPETAFPKQLEKELGDRYGAVEVINASVPAYSPYNEWQLYVQKVRAFHPHLVLVSFCMNDVVDPSLHWATLVSTGVGRAVPDAAVPNMRHHRDYALAELERRSMKNQGLLRRRLLRTELYAKIDAYLRTLTPLPHVDVGGKSFRTFLSGEDTTSMEVLADDGSPEWTWLRSIYDQLLAAVRADGAALAIVVNPLAYQTDPDYPIDPGPAFARYCETRKVPCFDLIPVMRDHRAEQPFVGLRNGIVDIWHYAPAGHRVAAHALADMILASGLLPKAGPPAGSPPPAGSGSPPGDPPRR